jgi:hypothetical protein
MSATDFNPVLEIRVKVIPLAASNGNNASSATKATITAAFDKINQIWAQSGVLFLFNPDTDLLPVKDDILVKDESDEARIKLAKQHPDSIVIFLRNVGGGASAGNSWYVNVGNNFEASHVAHEIGHYLHLQHTYSGARAVQAKFTDADGKPTDWNLDAKGGKIISAEELIRDWVLNETVKLQEGGQPFGTVPEEVILRGLIALDGDLTGTYPVTDTPPHFWELDKATTDAVKNDPNMRIAIKVRFNKAQIHTYYWRPDYNLMSYWHGVTYQSNGTTLYRATISPQQTARVRFALEKGNRYRVVQRTVGGGLQWGEWQMIGADVWSESAPALAPLQTLLYTFWRASSETRPPADTSPPDKTTRLLAMSLEDGPGVRSRFEVQGKAQIRRSPAAVSLHDFIWVIAVGLDDKVYSNSAQWGKPFGSWVPVGNGLTTNHSPAATALGERIYIFAVQNGSIKVCSTPFGQPWQKWTELEGLATDSPVAATAVGGRLYVVARGDKDHLVYFNSTAEGQPFGIWTLVPGRVFVVGPNVIMQPKVDEGFGMVASGDMLHLFARQEGGDLIYTWAMSGQQFDGKWYSFSLPAGVKALSAPAAANLDGRVYVAVLGSDKRIYFRWSL